MQSPPTGNDGKDFNNDGKPDDESECTRRNKEEHSINCENSERIRKKINRFREQRKNKHSKALIVIKRSNKIFQAFNLPKVMNLNPRSAMNKVEELKTFIDEESIDVAFISESHDRENKRLEDHFDLENYKVISNLYQRQEKGGRPALIVNTEKYNVQDITNTLIDIPWGVEVTWAILSPKNVTSDSTVQNIVLGSIYSKPNSKKKTATLDHIAETYNFLNAKYGRGLYWILAGDTNDMKLDPILHMSPSLKSVVTNPTRLNPDKILDNIITDLAHFYQNPECLPPLDADVNSGGKPSDHKIVVMKPISVIDNKPARITREVNIRPMKQSGIDLFGFWIEKQSWKEVLEAETVDKKSEILQNMLLEKLEEYLPAKKRKVCSIDQPFCTDEMKRLKRLKSREYSKNRGSMKWRDLNRRYKKEVSSAKRKYYKKMVKDLKTSNTNQWYSKLKRLCSYDQQKLEPVVVESIKHLSSSEQAEAIADKFARVSQEYEPLNSEDIKVPEFDEQSIPRFNPDDVRMNLEKIKTNKSVPPGDIPPQLIKQFAKQLSVPLCDIINSSILLGKWSKLYKNEMVTPVPKIFPPGSPEDLRNISGLLTFNKVAEKMIAELMISDIMGTLDPSQYANQKGVSLQHYLIKMIDKILTDTDRRSKGEVNAVLATLVDWKEAFPRQCPKLGVESFIRCGVRGSLIPLLINYLQDRNMKVKWNGLTSSERELYGGGPQGATFGIWEYLTQSNNSADCVTNPDYRYKFVDDLTVLEKINLLVIGLASFNCQASVPSNIPAHNQIIPAEHLKSQEYLKQIQEWTQNQKMILNKKKTKVMIFNFNNDHKFTTALKLDGEVLEVVEQAKLLGVVLTNDLKWNENTKYLVKKANLRLQLLRKVAEFSTSIEDKRTIYLLYVRSILEQSSVVWHSSLSQENSEDLERVQKSAVRIILGTKYENYEDGLLKVNLETLKDRRTELSKKFAIKCTKSDNIRVSDIFKDRNKLHKMNMRNGEVYKVDYAHTERLKNSSIPYMQRLLNLETKLESSKKRKLNIKMCEERKKRKPG